MPLDPNPCKHCRNEIPLDARNCPHCAYGMNFPNLIMAGQSSEREALEKRYQAALIDAAARGCEKTVRTFEAAVSNSQAIMGSTLQKLLPIVTRDRDVFATYHDLMELKFLRDETPDWGRLRTHAEVELLGSVKNIDGLHYAALSLNGRSLRRYGEATIQLREPLIAHRASVFEENSAVYVEKGNAKFSPGSRAIWSDRTKLCVAKLASKIDVSTRSDEFPGILMNDGSTPFDDEFVEVHVFGPMTIASFKKIVVSKNNTTEATPKRGRTRRGTTNERAIKDYCDQYGTVCEFQ